MNSRYSILYVDDEPSNLNIFRNTFRRNYNIFTAADAYEGMDILTKEHIDLIITDQRMPEINGVDFLKMVVEKYPEPHRILITAYTDFDALKNAVNEARIFQYIQKPWDEKYLQDVIDEALGIYTLKQKNQELTIELTEKNRELTEMDRLKNVFLQNISHEVRTPLNAIIGLSGILPDYFNDLEHLTEFTKIIHNRGYDLLDLMNNLMEVSLLEVNQVKINNAPFNLITFINELNEYGKNYQLKHDKTAITFKTKHALLPENEAIVTDGEKLTNIVYNLINNAFKYTYSGEIVVMFTINGDKLLIKVTDTGIGIPLHKHEKIFERFEQVEDEDINDGVGLGLAIVKGYINLLGGNIELSSTPGMGSVFTVYIPVNQPVLSLK